MTPLYNYNFCDFIGLKMTTVGRNMLPYNELTFRRLTSTIVDVPHR